MNLSALSNADLAAIAAGDMSKVSTEGLQVLTSQQTAKPETPAAPDPGVGMSVLIGAGRKADRIVKGVRQAYNYLTGDQEANQRLAADAESDDRLYRPLQQAHPFATGLGESVPAMILPGTGATTVLGNAAKMAASAALPELLSYGDLGDRAKNAGFAAAAGAAVPAAAVAFRTGKALVEPLYQGGRNAIVGRALNRAAGDSAPQVISKLNGAYQLVPGSAPTAAQVAESGGIAALERAAAAVDPDAYAARFAQQSSARIGALDSIAKDKAALDAAMAARGNATKPLYAAATAQTVPVTNELAAILARLPGDVTGRASRLARWETGSPIDMANALKAGTGTIGGDALHYLKLGVDDAISAGQQTGMGAVEQGLASRTASDLVGEIDKAIPAYQTARNTFAQMSEPINQMQTAQALRSKVLPALRDLGGMVGDRANAYAQALRDSEPLVRSATGLKNKELADVLTPSQMQTVTAIGKDLARKSNAENLGRGTGSDTVQKLAMSNIMGQAGLGPFTDALLDLPAISALAKAAYPTQNEKMGKALAAALLNPQDAAELMRKAQSRVLANNPAARKALAQALLRPSMAAAPVLQNLTATSP